MFAVSAGFQSTCLLVFSVCLQLIQLAAASSQSPQPTIDWEALQAGFEAQGVTIPSCLDRSYYLKYGWSTYANFTGGKRDIVLEVDWWDSALIVGYTFASLVTQVMGYNVDLRVYDGGAISGSRLHYGVSDIALELWGSDASTWYTQYVQLDSTVSNYGSVGYDGRVGLYFPSYLLDDYPHFDALDFWKGLTHPASQRIFPRFGTAPATLNDTGDGPLCDGIQNGCMNGSYVPAWYREEDRDSFFEIWHEDMTVTPYYYNRLIDGLKLNGTVRFLGNSVYTNMQQAYANRKPFLFYNWRPCVTTASYNLTRMIFPDDQTGQFQKFQKNPKHQSVNVDLPVENMFKASSSKFNADFPELGLFLSKFSFPEETMIHMLAVVGVNSYNFNDSQYTNLVCSWLKENEDVWSTWIPQPPARYDSCPRGTGRYLSQSLFVCLTCPPGTFNLNASTSIECQPCPANAICPGGDKVNAALAYWTPIVPDNITGDYVPELHLCPFQRQCCPSGNCSAEQVCPSQFAGTFCALCNETSHFLWNGECVACNGLGVSFWMTLLLPFIATGAIIFVPKYHAAEIEQLIFYFQAINLIFDGDVGAVLGWDGFNNLLALFSLNIDGLAFHCPIALEGISKQLFRFLLPFMILLAFLSYYTVLKVFPCLKRHLPEYMAIQNIDVLFARSFTIIFSFVFMPLVEAALVLINCDRVEGVNVLYFVPNVQCYSSEHVGSAVFAGIILITLLFVYPFGLLIVLTYLWRLNRISTDNDAHFKNNPKDQVYEAFYMPYRPKFFYMESVVIWERAVIVLIFTFLNHMKDGVAAIAYLTIFGTFCFTRAYIQPYKKLLQVYLNRELSIGFLVLLAIRQYVKYEPEAQNVAPLIVLIMFLPVVNHGLRWIRQGYLERHHIDTSNTRGQMLSEFHSKYSSANDVSYAPVHTNGISRGASVSLSIGKGIRQSMMNAPTVPTVMKSADLALLAT